MEELLMKKTSMNKISMKQLQNIRRNHHWIEVIIWAFCLNIIIELLSRDSVGNLVNHMTTYPMYFAYNLLIITCTLSLSAFFKRKKIAMVIISSVWIALGVANYVVLSYRITPFAAIDLSIMEWDMNFIEKYLSVPLVLAVVLATVGIGAMLVMVWKKARPSAVYWRKSLVITGVLLFMVIVVNYGFTVTGIYEARISNMQESYDKFGFVSCFTRSATERGIDEPENYSEEVMDNVVATLGITNLNHTDLSDTTSSDTTPSDTTSSDTTPSDTTQNDTIDDSVVQPNIIVVQLESFFDPSLLIDTEFSENPIPYFTELCEENSSGALEVSVVGAGTANTEFEVLTSMSVDYFGTGEYPYETILQEDTCESAAYNLKELGYTTFAMHNNTGTFYERNKVYPNLGFDTFISSEFMANTTTTPQGWIKDKYLTPQIEKCLESTPGEDFIFAVSVQGHGSFPKDKMENPIIEVTASPFDETLENQVEYYVNQIYEMDLFIKELTEYLSTLAEPTVLVLYGDHIPSLDIDASYYEDGDNYQTSYVFWANYELEEIDQDLCTYQLLPALLEQVDISEGVLTKLHQEQADDENYLEYLEMIQYDLLYGEGYIYDGADYEPTEMTMGVGDMVIHTYFNDTYVYITSSEITESSVVFINGEEVESTLTDSGNLRIDIGDIAIGDSLVIKQISPDDTVLYESETFFL